MWTTKRDDVPDILHHYCSTETFMKIIENKTIRLSNIFKMNDYSEVTHVLKLLPALLRDEYKKEPFPIKYKGKVNQKAFDDIISDLHNNINDVKYVSYNACFSKHEDDLEQWRGYGDNGKGIAIGYDGKLLFDLVQQCSFAITGVSYSVDEHKEYIRNSIVPEIFKALKKASDNDNVKNGYCSYEQMVMICVLSSVSAILLSAEKYKDRAYKTENDWRISINPFITQIYYPEDIKRYAANTYYGNIVLKKMAFNNKHGKGIISYYDLCFEKYSAANDLIKKIIIGPASNINDSDLDLKLFLQVNDFNIGQPSVSLSAIQRSKIRAMTGLT
ncbi:MAG: DUF2971 domain-containing protein [Smithella sp.]